MQHAAATVDARARAHARAKKANYGAFAGLILIYAFVTRGGDSGFVWMLFASVILCTAACAVTAVWYGARAHLPSALIVGLVLAVPSLTLLLWLVAVVAWLVAGDPIL
jgi:hypothetical protein